MSPLETTIREMEKAEKLLCRTLREVSGFKSTSAALAFIYKTKAMHPILEEEGGKVALALRPIPDVPRFFAIQALVDVIVDLQYQRSVFLQSIRSSL